MPRKPRQQRARATVDAIIEAGFISVARHGLSGTTTRHIAEIAGISVGSLYEYFDNKEAVLKAMHERVVADVVAMIQPLAPQLVRMGIGDAVRTLMREFAVFLRANDERYLKFARYILQLEFSDYLEPVTRSLMELVMLYVMSNPQSGRVRNITAASYVFINGGIFTVLRHLSDPNPPVSFEEMTEGLAVMASHYVAQEMLLTGPQRTPAD